MSRDRRRPRPLRFESLEGKQLLSTVAPAPARPSAAVASTPFDGTLTASAYEVSPVVGVVQTARIGLAGRVGTMGQVEGLLTEGIDESVEVVAKAKLVLVNAEGSVTMTLGRVNIIKNLTVPYNSGFTATYTITSATGAFAHSHGTGAIEVMPDIGDPDMHVTLHTT